MVIVFCCSKLYWRPSGFHCRSSQIIGEAIFKEIILIKVNKHFYTSMSRVVQTAQSWGYREFTKETTRDLGLNGWLGPSRWKGGRGIPGWRNRLDFREVEMKKRSLPYYRPHLAKELQNVEYVSFNHIQFRKMPARPDGYFSDSHFGNTWCFSEAIVYCFFLNSRKHMGTGLDLSATSKRMVKLLK